MVHLQGWQVPQVGWVLLGRSPVNILLDKVKGNDKDVKNVPYTQRPSLLL